MEDNVSADAALAERRPRILIVGFGDVAVRLTALIFAAGPIMALVRRDTRSAPLRAIGITPILADLSVRESLTTALHCDTLIHLAPPPSGGAMDSHTRNLVDALDASPPTRMVYVSTTGVYGNCHGAWIDESQKTNPNSARAVRRVDAEAVLTQWCRSRRIELSILRAPGIYAIDRLPIERIQKQFPALVATEDVYSNHIHADDLARIVAAAALAPEGWGVVNAVDGEPMKMGEYFDLVADQYALARVPRLPRAQLELAVPPMTLSFMSESRRIRNTRLRALLGSQLQYPSVRDFLRSLGTAAQASR